VANHILAIHLAAGQMEFAIAESTLRSLRVTALGRIDAASEVAREIVSERVWDRTVATLPADAAVFRLLDFPFHDRRRLAQAVGPALEEHVPMSLDEAETAYDFAGPGRRGRILGLMAARETVDTHLQLLRSMGIEPARLVWAPTATLEVYRRAGGDAAPFTALELAEDGATIATFDGHALTGLRIVRRADDRVFVRNLGWSLRTLDPPSDRVIVGGALAADLTGPLVETLSGLSLEPLPFDCPISLADAAVPGWRSSATPLGLALVAAGDAHHPVIDWPTSRDALPERAEMRLAARKLAPWAAVTIVSLAATSAFNYARVQRRSNALERQADAIFREVMPAGTGGAGKRMKMELRVAELERRETELSGGSGQGTPLGVLAKMSAAVPKDLDVEFDSYVYDPPHVRLRGQGGSFESVTRLQQLLQQSGQFGEVSVSDVRASATGEGVVFELTVKLGPKKREA